MSIASDRAKKTVILFALVLLISVGLCGANYVAFPAFGLPISGGTPPGPHGELKVNVSLALIGTAFLELLAMGVGAAGLLVSLVVWLFVVLTERLDDRDAHDER